jgi:hypothetical protein
MQNLFWVGLKESVNFRIVVIDRKVAFKLAHKKLAWMCGIDFCRNILFILSINKLSELANDNCTELCRECVIQSEYSTAPYSGICPHISEGASYYDRRAASSLVTVEAGMA